LRAIYHPRIGDTLVTIADRFGVTVQQLRRWNNLRGSAIEPGRSLYVAEPARVSLLHRARRRKGSVSSRVSRSSAKSGPDSQAKKRTSSREAKKKTAHSAKRKPV
jgi:membrane-bound lytic murein transglycosylase D